MTIRFYILPVQVVTDAYGGIHRGPAYIRWTYNPTGLPVIRAATKTYGSINLATVAVDAEQSTHDALVALPDVFQFPENIDVAMAQAERSAFTTYLEAHAVPGNWITAQDTWRTALRTVTAMFLFMQRLTTMTENVSPLDWGYNLNTQWRQMAATHQTAITDAARAFGYDVSFIKATTQVRSLLKGMADAWGAAPILFGFVTL